MSSPIAFAIRPRMLRRAATRITPLSHCGITTATLSTKPWIPVTTIRGALASSSSPSTLLLTRTIATTAFRGSSAQSTSKSKELITFYKTGLKTLWANQKEAKALGARVQEQGYVLNRSEFQLVNRSPPHAYPVNLNHSWIVFFF
ncbi:hypothetical protein BX666DRAFT_196420 [Dichotomocladium elegans]|nr:hypothetical protein BX666DRAFT_196420 [Dichotomocladium elegans]